MSIAPGQAQVQDERVVVVLQQFTLDQTAVVAPVDPVAALLECKRQPLAQSVLVFGQQDPHASHYQARCPGDRKLIGGSPHHAGRPHNLPSMETFP